MLPLWKERAQAGRDRRGPACVTPAAAPHQQRQTAQQHMQEYAGLSQRLFSAYRRLLDKEEPDYRA